MAISAPYGKLRTERLGTVTKKDLRVLCYQHHKEMLLRLPSDPAQKLVYVCKESGCLIRYNSSDGYFIHTEDAKSIEQEMAARVSCPNDEHPMYLAEVRPETRNFRLWKCPKCNASRTNEESSPGWGKKMGA
jgi:hypothetical protein